MLKYLFLGTFFLLNNPLIFSQFTLYNLPNTGEQIDKVTSIGVLNSGYVYVGTYDKGMAEYNGFTWTGHDVLTSANFPNNYITSIYINSSEIWIGTRYGGIGKYNGSSWSKITTSNSSLPDNEVFGMQMDAQGDLCIATYSGFAIDSIPKSTWRIYNSLNTPALVPETESFYCIAIDPLPSKTIWLGTRGSGLAKLNNDTWQFYKTQNSDIANDSINVVKRSSNGNYWVGTDVGLSKFDGTNWTTYTVSSTSGGLPGDKINSIAFDNSGNVYVGTNNGLGVLNINFNQFKATTTSNSNLPGNNITAVALNPNTQEVWLGTASQGVATAAYDAVLGNEDKINTIQDIIAFPNPADDFLNINFACKKETDVKIFFLDLLGREVLNMGTHKFGAGVHTFREDLSALGNGLYLLMMETEDGIITKRILVY